MPERVLRHVVLFSFKETATPAHGREIERAFCALPEKIPTIHAFEWGTDVSIENANQDFSHCFLVTFLSEEDRNAYLPHPAHQAFVAVLQPHLAKVLVFDYWSEGAVS